MPRKPSEETENEDLQQVEREASPPTPPETENRVDPVIVRQIVREEIQVQLSDTTKDNPLLNKEMFANTRKMGWVSLVALLIFFPLCVLFLNPDKVQNYQSLFEWGFGTLAMIVAATIGAKSLAYHKFIGTRSQE